MQKTTTWLQSVICAWFQESGRSCSFTAGSVTTTNFHGCSP